MIDWWTLDVWQHYSLWLMFASAFLSATVLPGNSEVVFVALLTPLALGQHSFWTDDMLYLLTVAVSGNSLGSLTTYWLGRWLPTVQVKQSQHPSFQWVMRQLQRYGVWSLLLSWLPVVGDVLCAVAGWLRFNMLGAFLLITIGKLIRYIFLLLFTMNFLTI